MNYLITGAAGFIGSQVCAQLLARGDTVVGVDNMNDAYDVQVKQWRLAQLQGKPGFAFHHLDITNRAALSALCDPARPFDAVINLAARAGVRASVTDPWIYFETNVTGTLNLLEVCRASGVKKFVLASSSSVYGDKSARPFHEDANTDAPFSPYAASKKAAETLCYAYHHLHGIDVTVFRYFTVFGPAGRPDMSMFRFVQWISEGQPVTVYGDGKQARDFTYVDDVARGTILGLSPLGYEIINLGSDTPIVLMDALQTIENLVGRQANLQFQPAHPADMDATWADISKAKRLLAWSPQTRFAEGARNLVAWYQENRAWARNIRTL
jgi:UDP-glucuronate 4-epimerase